MACSGCDWDPEKDLENQRKHGGIRFEDACCVFDDPYREETEDERDYDEDLFIVLGKVGAVVLVVVYTERSGVERIISARKAEPREERASYARVR
jgi:uncharacterized DUF497 family protein